jgi:undecaprenyl-diphosphatase
VIPVAETLTLVLSLLLMALAWRELGGGAGVTGRALVLGGLAVLLLTVLFAAVLDAVRDAAGPTALDQAGLQLALDRRTGPLTAVVAVATDVGSTAFLVVVVLVAGPPLVRRDRSRLPFGVLAAAAGTAGLVVVVGKAVVGRERPPAELRLVVEESASFPSGHSLGSMAVYVVLAWLIGQGLRSGVARAAVLATFLVIAIGVGVSRVYLGVHWVTDVLASWLLAGILVLTVVTATSHALGRRAALALAADPPVRGPGAAQPPDRSSDPSPEPSERSSTTGA